MLELDDKRLLREAALIGGEWVPAQGNAPLAVTDPASGAVVGKVPECGTAMTEAAVAAAGQAWPAWRARTAHERAAILERWHALVLASENDLARILTTEQGKPLAEAKGEIRYAASFIKLSDGTVQRLGQDVEGIFGTKIWK